ncbi:MAG: hypothetical protein QOG33_1902 [Gaiellales bacterium]|jgi:hypothetical protein|nr:hypothetical protein [Gaiellales bacterium]
MPRRNDGLHIIVANEPRAYREALVGVLAARSPRDEVNAAEPSEIDELLRRRPGALVICTEVSEIVSELAGAWVRLDAEGGVAVSSFLDGQAMARRDGLGAVLDAVDAAGESLRDQRSRPVSL